jgi:hypothetical protein
MFLCIIVVRRHLCATEWPHSKDLHYKGARKNYLQKLNLWITIYLIISLSAIHLINFMEKGNK